MGERINKGVCDRESHEKMHKVDLHVGNVLRTKRILCGLSQADIAEKVGVTFQQVQKYERGLNRLSVGRIYDFSLVINEPACCFFKGLPGQDECKVALHNTNQGIIADDVMVKNNLSRDAMELIRAFYSIEDANIRNKVKDVLRTIVASTP
jgi:transcriptional regulator with XRE-family HTH domain